MSTMKSKKKKAKNYKMLILGVIIAIVFSCIYARTDVKHALYDEKLDTADWITTSSEDAIPVLQGFKAEEKFITGVQTQLAYTGENGEGKLKVEILDEKGKTLGKGSINFEDIKSGRINKIKLDEKVYTKIGKTYFIRLTQKSAEKGQGLAYSYTTTESEYQFKEASVTMNGSLVIRTLTHRFSYETFFVCLFFIIFIVAFMKILFKLFKA